MFTVTELCKRNDKEQMQNTINKNKNMHQCSAVLLNDVSLVQHREGVMGIYWHCTMHTQLFVLKNIITILFYINLFTS